jgi:DnaJ-domain-containing protein 1
LPDNGFVLLEHGKIVAVIDVDAINGASRPDRLAMYVKRAFEPKRSSDRASVPGSKAAIAIGDPYEVLGVSASASDEEIKSKYKKLLLEYHPDRVAHLGQELRELAERKTTQINAALSEIRNRRKI